MRTNGVAAHTVLEGRLLRHLVHDLPAVSSGIAGVAPRPYGVNRRLQAPVFIVAAPRSGSTVLFETLRVTDQLWSLQDEAHWLVETIPELRPGMGGVDSNRLTAGHCTPAVAERITGELLDNLRAPDGGSLASTSGAIRFLEKTPKNALRIPFFSQMFPDARFVLLWRDPRENLSSIMEAWRSGRWTTYRVLEGWDGPWSLLLPPGWQALRGRPLEEVAAYQWECANRIALEDLASLPRARWTSVRYSDLVSDPGATLRRLCDSLGLDFDHALAARVNGPLPLSRYTQTPPDPEKWRRNEKEVLRVLPSIEPTWRWLQSLDTF